MSDIIQIVTSNLLENDVDGLYRQSLSLLSNKDSRLKKFKIASTKVQDEHVLEATKVVIDAALQVDSLLKQANFEKESMGIIKSLVLKTLKIAQKILAGLLLLSPLRVGIAYNAMYNVIKYFEKRFTKSDIKKVEIPKSKPKIK